jgi:hypothetical protein
VKMRNRTLIFLLILLAVIPLTAFYGEEKPKLNKVASDSLSSASPSILNESVENPVFEKVEVSGKSGSYRVEGLVKPLKGTFYYSVEDGHHQQIQETKVKISGVTTGLNPFVLKFKIPNNQLPHNGTLMLNLYERENDMIVHQYSIVLEKFY